jgi:hypothetical protein
MPPNSERVFSHSDARACRRSAGGFALSRVQKHASAVVRPYWIEPKGTGYGQPCGSGRHSASPAPRSLAQVSDLPLCVVSDYGKFPVAVLERSRDKPPHKSCAYKSNDLNGLPSGYLPWARTPSKLNVASCRSSRRSCHISTGKRACGLRCALSASTGWSGTRGDTSPRRTRR